MEIQRWHIAEADRLTEIYNQHMADVPYTPQVSSDELQESVNLDDPCLSDQKLFVGLEKGTIAGFAHAAKYTGEDAQAIGLIRFLVFGRDKRSIGQTIIKEVEQYFRQLGLKTIRAFDKRYYCNSDPTLPDRWDHVCAMFGHCGYEVALHGLFTHLPNYKVSRPPPPCSDLVYSVEPYVPERKPHDPQHRTTRPGTLIHLRRDDGWVGTIKNCPLSVFVGGEKIQDVWYVHAFGVGEKERGRGYGRYLLEVSLWEMQQIGYKTATLHVIADNYRAQLLYLSLGFRTLFRGYRVAKELEEEV